MAKVQLSCDIPLAKLLVKFICIDYLENNKFITQFFTTAYVTYCDWCIKNGISDGLVGTSKNNVALITIYHFIKLQK